MIRFLRKDFFIAGMMFLFFLRPSPLLSDSLPNLEEGIQDFVLETKKIEIPGYPHAFNAAIIKWQDALLMSFRTLPDPKDTFHSLMGLVWLDNNFEPMGEPHILNVRPFSSIPHRTEDARLICMQDRLFIVYQDNVELKISKKGFRMYVAELCYDGQTFAVNKPLLLSPFEGESPDLREKNWVPFIYKDQLFLAYSLIPHRILFPLLETGECLTAFQTTSSIHWNWGELRGGTPALIDQNQYLAFFHSSTKMATCHSQGENIDHYFMGAYTFSKEPPFAINQISPSPIIGPHFYEGENYKPYWRPVQVVFPCGLILEDSHIWISYGRQDYEIWVAKLDKQALLQSLIPVDSSGDYQKTASWD